MAVTRQSYADISRMWIDGQWVTPSGPTLELVSPCTGEVIDRAAMASTDDANRALLAARRAFDQGEWSKLEPAVRGSFVAKIADGLAGTLDRSSEALTAEMGKAITTARRANDYAVAIARDFAGMSAGLAVEEERSVPGGVAHVIREPVGVVLAIIPWNAPLSLAVNKLAPALVGGCCVVVKMAPETPYNDAILAEAVADAGLPPGVVSIVTADTDVSAAMVTNPLVDKISFTGSLEVGRQIIRASAERMTRVTLELGGKSAAIVLDDADFTTLVPSLLVGTLNSSGQACRALTRYLVPRSRSAEFVDAVTNHIGDIPVGDPFDPATIVGPLVSARQRDRVESYIQAGLADGGRLIAGGGRPPSLPRGWYVEPTVFADVTRSMTIAQEEIFGPVIAILDYDDEDDAIAIANDSIYGLSGAVFTEDLARGRQVAARVRTGTFNVGKMGVSVQQPFGGYKCSGIGREGGPEGLDAYLEYKQVFMPQLA
jgi:aldehyde dehydrogenase (NAD+)